MKRSLIALCFVGLLLGVCSCKQKNQCAAEDENAEVVTTRLSADDFKKVIQDTVGVVLLDVRSDEEYQQGHIEHAIHIDFRKDTFLDNCLKQLPRKKIAIYCRNGFCSHSAAKMLQENGFDVVDLIGGYNGWTKAGGEQQACK